ncbi:MAG: TIM barrel protein [Candidatus Woesearchaeota archaeon]
MAIFNIDYFTTLDRGYYSPETMKASMNAGTYVGTDFPEATPVSTKLTAREIGTTMAPDTYPLQELQAKIRTGALKLEMEFGGAGKSGFGGRSATPEVLDKREREEFRKIAELNDVRVSTHATYGKQGLSGLTQQGFSEEEAQKTLKEINKAIDFAATATHGGAVVFHTGEWQRPIMDAGLKNPDKTPKDKRMFGEYEKEWDKAPIYLADENTGQIMALNREMKFYFPEEEKDPKTGMTNLKKSKEGQYQVKEYDFNGALQYIKNRHKGDKELENKTDAQILMFGLKEQQLKEAEGQAFRFSVDLEDEKKALQKVIEQRKVEERIWQDTPEKDKWKLMEPDRAVSAHDRPEYIPRKDALAKEEERLRRAIQGNQSTVASSLEQYERIKHEMERFKPIEEVGIKRTADTLAKAGLKAMKETEIHRKELKEAIYIAPENVFPDFYGSHADELIRIVEESRKEMTRKLKEKGFSESEAKSKAETHIRATLDTGHLNNWRQHFKGSDKDFNKWYVDQIQKMIDKKIIGHIHLTDNWGYDDEHLTPGQGNTPNKEIIKMLENAGFKDFIAEVGSFNANTILPDTLAEFGSPVYALGRSSIPWGKVRHGHFGYAAPPNYIVGAYSPSNDFKLWSEVPLE